jgi:hypothetical protein
MWVLTYGALALWLMPTAYRLTGLDGVLWFFALFPLITLPWLKYFPVTGENVAQVEKDAVDLAGAGRAARWRRCSCISSRRVSSGRTCS